MRSLTYEPSPQIPSSRIAIFRKSPPKQGRTLVSRFYTPSGFLGVGLPGWVIERQPASLHISVQESHLTNASFCIDGDPTTYFLLQPHQEPTWSVLLGPCSSFLRWPTKGLGLCLGVGFWGWRCAMLVMNDSILGSFLD